MFGSSSLFDWSAVKLVNRSDRSGGRNPLQVRIQYRVEKSQNAEHTEVDDFHGSELESESRTSEEDPRSDRNR